MTASSNSSWVCDGIPKNGKEYTGLGGAHEPHENYALDCEICGLPKESSASKKTTSPFPVKTVIPVALVACLGVGLYIFRCQIFSCDTCAEGQVMLNGNCVTEEPDTIDNQDSILAFASEWVSLGERHLFKGKSNTRRDDGIVAFKNGDLVTAEQNFQQAVADDKNDPEIQIYLNNTQAALQGSPFKIAAVVPVEEKEASATEMLRGIADAQTEFNNQGGIAGRLVQVVVANDSNDSSQARSIARELAKDRDILGIIGHNSSGVSRSALNEYEKARLVMISPTSTATDLSNDYFLRTVPTDAISGKKLAEYAQKAGVSRVAIFYDATSSYSKSLQKAFESNFSQLGGNILRSIDISSPNFNSEQEIKNLKQDTDAIALFPSTKTTSVAIGIARANTELPGEKLTMLGGDALYSSDVLNQGGTDVNGLIIAIPWFSQSQPYAQKANKRWIGTINWRTAASFDAAKALLKSLEDNADRASVRQNLQSVSLAANETSGEPLSFANSERENVEPVLVQIDSGSYRQSGQFANGFKLIEPLF